MSQSRGNNRKRENEPEQPCAIEAYKRRQLHIKKERNLMTSEFKVEKDADWKKFMMKHWGVFAVFVVAVILAAIGAVYVFWWFVGYAQTTNIVPSTLGFWSMANVVFFVLYLIFWEFVFIGIPAIIGAVIGWQWWRRLPEDEKREYHLFGRGSRSRNAGGVLTPLLFIALAIKVYVDGNWNVPISTYTLDYIAGSMITILAWAAAIFGIPATIALIWWLHREINKKP